MTAVTFDGQAVYAALARAIGAQGDAFAFQGFHVAAGAGPYADATVMRQPDGSVIYQRRQVRADGVAGVAVAIFHTDGFAHVGHLDPLDAQAFAEALAELAYPTPAGERDPGQPPRWSEWLQVAEDDDEHTHVALAAWGGRTFLLVEDVVGDSSHYSTRLFELMPGVASSTFADVWSHTWSGPGGGDRYEEYQETVRGALREDLPGFLGALARGQAGRWLIEWEGDPCLFSDEPEECEAAGEAAARTREDAPERY
jgi:hypothetical protein